MGDGKRVISLHYTPHALSGRTYGGGEPAALEPNVQEAISSFDELPMHDDLLVS